MTDVVMRVSSDRIEAAARTLGIWDSNLPLARMGNEVLRQVAGDKRASAIAEGGAAPKRAGRHWENVIVGHAQDAGLPWDRAPLRGTRDLLDVTGCLPGGWLVGAKSTSRGVSAAVKIADAMDQCHRAMSVLEAQGKTAGVIPWQIVQRPGAETGRAYAITEYDWMLRICQLRQDAWTREERM